MGQFKRSRLARFKAFILGNPVDIGDRSIFHKLALIPILAWVGLGSDGLSSSSYGPEEAFKTLGAHTYLAIFLVLATGLTVLIISAAYSRIIEDFPHGGGGYVVASKLLGHRAGVVSGCALLVDYVLTITVSIAAAGDALFSFMPLEYHFIKLPLEAGLIILLILLNLRGVKDSVLVLTPIFVLFLITHVAAIFGGIFGHLGEIATTTHQVSQGFSQGSQTLGVGAMFLLFIHAYSMGGGTYTGIEAVSNGLPIMRDPKVYTAKRTMLYMALSLAFTASGLLLCYLLWGISPVEGKTMNAVLFEKMTSGFSWSAWFVIPSLVAEGLLLVVAAQAGFIDGPRVLANMAVDSWMPRRFAAVSDRLTTSNGIALMGISSLIALFYARGDVGTLVVMYSINVFLTFSLSIFGMLRHYLLHRKEKLHWRRHVLIFTAGFVLCASILVITTIEKFAEGGWITLLVTAGLVMVCFWVKGRYLELAKDLRHLHADFSMFKPAERSLARPLNKSSRVAVILVGGYGGLGLQTLASILKNFPGVYETFIFVTVGVIDSGVFKGENSLIDLKSQTEKNAEKYVHFVQKLGFRALARSRLGTEIVETGFDLCEEIAAEYPDCTYFTGKVIFEREHWYHRILHNETAVSLQKRIQIAGHTMVILPARVYN